ncbi:hypothetical protein ACFQ7B_33565 [Streptomyces erythrochromogenes]|uniref:hypothetical protein n=1 Tax=Streptomyces erythrochromogenes TaxID=285574 RepID=UPI0036BF774A
MRVTRTIAVTGIAVAALGFTGSAAFAADTGHSRPEVAANLPHTKPATVFAKGGGFELNSAPESGGIKLNSAPEDGGIKLNSAPENGGIKLNSAPENGGFELASSSQGRFEL